MNPLRLLTEVGSHLSCVFELRFSQSEGSCQILRGYDAVLIRAVLYKKTFMVALCPSMLVGLHHRRYRTSSIECFGADSSFSCCSPSFRLHTQTHEQAPTRLWQSESFLVDDDEVNVQHASAPPPFVQRFVSFVCQPKSPAV